MLSHIGELLAGPAVRGNNDNNDNNYNHYYYEMSVRSHIGGVLAGPADVSSNCGSITVM